MNILEKLSGDKSPDICEFYSCLKDECISEKDYLHAVNVWIELKMNTTGDYHNLYLKTDLLLLTDAFEKFINTCLKYYGLDPCHYFSSPGLSLDTMLKMTGIELEPISDIKMHLFIEEGMRRDISYIAKRYSKAKNKYITYYDSSKSKLIIYLDTNNLYW